jgi:hypothetical protein
MSQSEGRMEVGHGHRQQSEVEACKGKLLPIPHQWMERQRNIIDSCVYTQLQQSK